MVKWYPRRVLSVKSGTWTYLVVSEFKMENTEEDSNAMDNSEMTTVLNYKNSKTHKASQFKVVDFVQKLNSWSNERKESQTQLDNLLYSYSGSIIKEVNDLTDEVSDLQLRFSVITKERNDMILAVNKMRGEIDQLRARSSTAQPSPDPEEDYDLSTEETSQESEMPAMKIPDELEYDSEMEEQESHQIRNTAPTGKERFENGKAQTPMRPNQYPFDGQDELADTSLEDLVHDVDNYKEHEIKEAEKNECVFPNCDFIFSTVGNLEEHFENVHSIPDFKESDESHSITSENPKWQNIEATKSAKIQNGGINRVQNKTYKCAECLYQSKYKANLTQHIEGVHEKVRSHVCKDCGYAASQKVNLMRHIKAVHGKIRVRSHVGKDCGYTASQKVTLMSHIKAVHEKIRDHVCEECGYASSRKDMLKRHWVRVHKICEKMHKCEDCAYAGVQKVDLKRHRESVHNIGEQRFVCNQCPFKSYRKGPLRTHIKSVHL